MLGLGAAIALYLTAGDEAADALGYEMAGGQAYPVDPGSSKIYLHDVELYGGKAAVLADAFMRWFAGLWQGKSLGLSVGSIAVVLALGLALAARRLPPED